MSFVTAPPTAAAPHAQATSTGTGNQQTITPPANARGCIITATTNGARVTFDGTVPTSANGIPIVAGGVPVPFPFAVTINFVSMAAGSSIVDVLWLT